MLAAMPSLQPQPAMGSSHSGGSRFVQLAESGVVGLCVGNVHGDLLDANDAYLSLIGFSRSEFDAGMVKWSERTPAEWATAHHAALDALKRTGAATSWEAELLHKDGNRVPVLLAVGTLDYPNTVTIVTDLTPIRRAHDARQRTEARLGHAQKMEAIGNLAGGMAHEFNNLLSVIVGYSGMLAADLDAADPMLDVLNEVRTAGERAAVLTRQLLTFSRHQLARPLPIDLTEVVAGAREVVRSMVGDRIDVVFATASWLPTVFSDAERVREAIVNLAANARDAMPPPDGGTLRIETRIVTVQDADSATQVDLAPGDYVTLSVSDTGAGMDRTTQARMFEPFFTTKGVGQGTGLGLSTVFGIVQQSGGSIRTESELGRGTTVRLYFPAAYTDVGSAVPANDADVTSLDGSETVLVVDEEAAVRSLAGMVLRRHGYTVIEAAGSGDAFLAWQRRPEPIHLLLTDVSLPRMSGRDLAGRLRQLWPQLNVLYMSGFAPTAVIRHGVVGRDAAFLQKPFTAAALVRAVRRALDTPVDGARAAKP
jgi:PAS domain S-box-containing protein